MTAPGRHDRHFDTAHLREGIGRRTLRGGAVTMAAQGGKVLLQIATIAALARLLSPQDFGLYAIAAAVMTFMEIFKDLGLNMATVQRAELTQRQVSTLFWVNLGLAGAIGLLTAALAPLFGWFYGEPPLVDIMLCLAGAFLLTGAGTQHLALLRRQMRFSLVAGLQTVAEVAAMAAAVAAALAGMEYWALVVQRLVWAAVTGLGAWLACDWRPGRPGRLGEVADMVRFGSDVTGSMLINHLASNLDRLLIGWMWGIGALGLYERAQRLVSVALQNLNTPLFGVAVPALSRLVGDPQAYRRAYLSGVAKMAMLVAPFAAVVVACPDRVIGLMFGPEWVVAAPILAVFAVRVIYAPVSMTTSWLFMSQGRSREMLHAGVINAALTVAAVAAGLPFGPLGVAVAVLVNATLFRVPLLFWLAGRRGPVSWRDLAGLVWPSLLPALGVIAAIRLLRTDPAIEQLGDVSMLALATAFSVALSLLWFAGLPRTRSGLRDIVRMPRQLLGGSVRA